jgi:hypothetical protein
MRWLRVSKVRSREKVEGAITLMLQSKAKKDNNYFIIFFKLRTNPMTEGNSKVSPNNDP